MPPAVHSLLYPPPGRAILRRMDAATPSPLRKVLRLDIHEIELCCGIAASAARLGTYDGVCGTPYLDLMTGTIEDISDDLADEGEPEEIDWDRYLSFPDDTERLEWRDLIEFAEGLEHASQRAEVLRLADGCGAFRRVKDYVLGSGQSDLKHAWHWFVDRKSRERIVDWLHSAGIEPDWGCDIFAPPPELKC